MTPDRTAAVIALVQTPDAFDGLRTHVLKIDGKPERFEVWRYLPMAYVVQALVERDKDYDHEL